MSEAFLSHTNDCSDEKKSNMLIQVMEMIKFRDIAFEIALCHIFDTKLSKIATFVQISSAKVAIHLIQSRNIVSSGLHYLQDHNFL